MLLLTNCSSSFFFFAAAAANLNVFCIIETCGYTFISRPLQKPRWREKKKEKKKKTYIKHLTLTCHHKGEWGWRGFSSLANSGVIQGAIFHACQQKCGRGVERPPFMRPEKGQIWLESQEVWLLRKACLVHSPPPRWLQHTSGRHKTPLATHFNFNSPSQICAVSVRKAVVGELTPLCVAEDFPYADFPATFCSCVHSIKSIYIRLCRDDKLLFFFSSLNPVTNLILFMPT